MQRIPEPELMDDEAQAKAYAGADFSEPHEQFVALFRDTFPGLAVTGTVLDLGCGPADVLLRFARAFPACRLDGVDGAAAMLRYGGEAVARAGLEARIRLIQAYLPAADLPKAAYDLVISNSLLHHLAAPRVLWNSIKTFGKPGAPVFVMDLMRPGSLEQVRSFVLQYAATEPEVLQRDFHNSLCAAYRPGEVAGQLREAGLEALEIQVVSDRHWVAYGHLPA